MSNKRETMVFIDRQDVLHIFVVFIIVFLLGAIFLVGMNYGRSREIERFFTLCDSDSSFDIEGREGIFGCYRMDREPP